MLLLLLQQCWTCTRLLLSGTCTVSTPQPAKTCTVSTYLPHGLPGSFHPWCEPVDHHKADTQLTVPGPIAVGYLATAHAKAFTASDSEYSTSERSPLGRCQEARDRQPPEKRQ